MGRNTLKRAAGALALAFMIVAAPAAHEAAAAIRDAEPASCTVGNRTYNPIPASITIDARTGAIIAGENIDARLPPASMTKMMTAALIFEALRDGRLSLQDPVKMRISPAVRATSGNSRGTWLAEGTVMTVEEAILAIGVASANNVAVLMAERLAGSEAGFVALMNAKAKELGMQNTVFKNSSGLPAEGQFSTARDMAKLALHLLRDYPQYYGYFSAPQAEFGPWRGAKAKGNHNELALRHSHIDGIKTGFICASGYNLAASGIRDGKRVITVVFGGRTPHQRNERARALIEEGLQILQQPGGQEPPVSNASGPSPPPPVPLKLEKISG